MNLICKEQKEGSRVIERACSLPIWRVRASGKPEWFINVADLWSSRISRDLERHRDPVAPFLPPSPTTVFRAASWLKEASTRFDLPQWTPCNIVPSGSFFTLFLAFGTKRISLTSLPPSYRLKQLNAQTPSLQKLPGEDSYPALIWGQPLSTSFKECL